MSSRHPARKPSEGGTSTSQQVSVRWDDGSHTARPTARLQFEVAECVETKTVTTTTTTKRSYSPLYVREPRPLSMLDSKEYPLASRPTPPELTRFTFSTERRSPDAGTLDDGVPISQTTRSQSDGYAGLVSFEPDLDTSVVGRRSLQLSDPPTETQPRGMLRASARGGSPSYGTATDRRPQKSAEQVSASGLHHPLPKARRAATGRSDRVTRASTAAYLATPDTTEFGMRPTDRPSRRTQEVDIGVTDAENTDNTQSSVTYDAASPAPSDSPTAFSNNVATPPITDADLEPFGDADEANQQPVRPFYRRPSLSIQDATLPSPRLSPTLAAAQLHMMNNSQTEDDAEEEGGAFLRRQLARGGRTGWLDDSQANDDGEASLALSIGDRSPMQHSGHSGRYRPARHGSAEPPSMVEPRSMIETFDAMPNELKSFMMYQFLRRCPRKTLRMVAGVVTPALKCDFLKQLPVELGLHVLSYLDYRDLCRAARVSKHWRNLVDTNETGWKELLDRDGFELPAGELERAIAQGWGWQDPVGVEGCELDLSMQSRLTSSESELIRSAPKVEPQPPRLRSSKRKRGLTHNLGPERSKRRLHAQETVKDGRAVTPAKDNKSEGPITAANAAAMSVPDPQVGLPSLRKLHLFKSLYRRHHMIRQSWTSGKVKFGHVAFAAHPRHVITCLQFDDDKIITGSDDTLIQVYDTKTGKLLRKLEGHEGGVWALQYQGNTLVSGSTDRSVRVWDIEKGLCTQVFYGHTSTVRCLQILMPTDTGRVENGRPVIMPPKPLIITGSRDNQLRVWRLPDAGSRRYIQTGPPANDAECPYFIRILSGHTGSVRAIAAHGDTLVSGSYDSTVRVWRISTGEALHVLHGHSQKVYSVVLDHKRNRCISGSMDSLVKIWDLDTGECLHSLEGHSLLVGLLDLCDDKLVSAAADSTLRVWDPETGKCKSTLMAHTGAITCFQHDGRKVISGSEKGVKMWDIHTGELIQDLLTGLNGVWQVRFDGRRCVAAVQRDNLTFIEILDFGAIRDGLPPEELGKRRLLNENEVQQLLAEDQ